MKRELKIRAWDAKAKQMVYFDEFNFYNTGGFWGNGIEIYHIEAESRHRSGKLFDHDFSSPVDMESMEYTGLKDKHGKEVYEGDWVKHDAWDYPFEVIYNQERARFVCKMKTGLTQYIDNERLAVISNIHENPELIKS